MHEVDLTWLQDTQRCSNFHSQQEPGSGQLVQMSAIQACSIRKLAGNFPHWSYNVHIQAKRCYLHGYAEQTG